MAKYKKEEIIKVKVTGLQQYGAFVVTDDDFNGLIHISEISYGYVKKIEDYVNVGDKIYSEVLSVDEENNQLQLSIKDIDYKKDGGKLKDQCDLPIVVPHFGYADRIQEVHTMIIHIMIRGIESKLKH